MEIILSVVLTIFFSFRLIVATPVNSDNSNSNSNKNVNTNDNSNSQQTIISDEVTAYPDMQKLYVDLSNVSPDVSILLRRSKLDIDQIRSQQERLRNRKTIENDKNRYEVIASSTTPAQISQDNAENFRLLKIQSELEATLRAENLDGNNFVSPARPEKPQFEYAFAAACDVPRHMNITKWFDGKTWNVMFKPIYRRYNVISSTIRLYKIKKDEDTSISNECDVTTNELYTITVSVYVRKRKEIKKKIIFTRVIQSSFAGWLEIDALGTLSFWDQAKNNLGIAVDVYDANEEPLDAREHFRLQNCNEAEPVIPWGAFEFLVKQSSTGTVSSADVERLQQMHSFPRLDLTSTTPPIYDDSLSGSKNNNNDNDNGIEQNHSVDNNRPQRHIRHQTHRKHHIQNIDNAVLLLKNKLHKRREHLHRDDNSTTGGT